MSRVFNLNRYDKIVANDLSLNGTISTALGGLSQWEDSGSNIYFSGGNVGIGTTSPESTLHVEGATYLTNTDVVVDGYADTAALVFRGGRKLGVKTDNNGNLSGTISGGGTRQTRWQLGAEQAPSYFLYNNFGIGTTNPSAKLHVYDSSSFTEMYIGGAADVDKTSIIRYNQGNGSGTGKLLLGHWGDPITTGTGLSIIKGGNIGIGNSAPASLLSVGDGSDTIPFIAGSYNASYPPLLNIRDDTYNDAASIAHFSRRESVFQFSAQAFFHKRGSGDLMVIYTSSGNIYFGNSTRGTYIRFSTSGQIAPSTSFSSAYSDDRIKFNETDISNCLSIVRQLHAPQKYERFIPKEENDQIQACPTDASWNEVKLNEDINYYEEIGFIAQEIKQVPELAFSVTGDEYDASGNVTPLLLDYGNIHNITTGAVKELDAIVQQQQTIIAALEERISALENPN